MAEEKGKDKSNDIPKGDDKDSKEKQTNKVFTQSEHDSAIAKIKDEFDKKFFEHQNELKEAKEQLEKIAEEKKKIEREKMTKEEREKQEKSEILQKVEQLAEENSVFKQKIMINEVVDSDPNFDDLPRMYRNNIKGATIDEIQQSAQTMLDEWSKDKKSIRSKPKDVGAPDLELDLTPSNELKPVNPKQAIRSKLENMGLLKKNE
jgi:hypothetical protein